MRRASGRGGRAKKDSIREALVRARRCVCGPMNVYARSRFVRLCASHSVSGLYGAGRGILYTGYIVGGGEKTIFHFDRHLILPPPLPTAARSPPRRKVIIIHIGPGASGH